MSEARLNILVVRPDRIGDVILSTPVFDVLKRHYPRAHVTVMVREAVAPLIRGMETVDEVIAYDPDGRHSGIGGLFRLISDFRERKYRIAVVLHSEWKIAAALFGAGVRYRVGPLSKIHSYLFYNRGVRQRRSHVEMHETDYNLQLLRRIGIRVGTRNVPLKVCMTEKARTDAAEWLRARGWKPDERQGKSLVAVHPGMGGSALNWPESHYVELIRSLIKDGHGILITAGPTEGALIERMRNALGPTAEKVIFFQSDGKLSIDFLAGLFSCTDLVVAPSTGPLHLGVALGKPVVSFYPPIRVQSALRWGPYLADEKRASVLVPEVYCGQDFECRGNLCHYFPCMRSITVTQAIEQVQKHLSNSRGTPNASSSSGS